MAMTGREVTRPRLDAAGTRSSAVRSMPVRPSQFCLASWSVLILRYIFLFGFPTGRPVPFEKRRFRALGADGQQCASGSLETEPVEKLDSKTARADQVHLGDINLFEFV